MRYGITLLGDRVAPRSTCADALLVVVLRRSHRRVETRSALASCSLLGLAKVLSDNRIDTLVCGGISREERDYLTARRVVVVDNVVASVDELLAALDGGTLRTGFGLNTSPHQPMPSKTPVIGKERTHRAPIMARDHLPPPPEPVDCLACRDRACLNGEPCPAAATVAANGTIDGEIALMMETALDISSESERTLCRLSELIYFCLEMHYERIGLAYCVELEEPAEILTRVLRRFFMVFPICCKIGGERLSDSLTVAPGDQSLADQSQIACNPVMQAEALNRLETDINVLVGLCVGADCIFARTSNTPVTTLFVKDKSLANNPIGAVYSDYYIKEAIEAVPGRSGRNSLR